MKALWLRLVFAVPLCWSSAIAPVSASEQASGLRLIGSDPLQGRSAYQLVPHQQDGRWLLYVGHMPGRALNPQTGVMEDNGMSILDVSDPARPKYLHHEPPSDMSWYQGKATTSGTYHIQVCDGSRLPHAERGRTYALRTVGEVAHEVLDVTDSVHPRFLTQVTRAGISDLDGIEHTHKNFWDCVSGIAYLVTSVPGWRATQVLQVFDLSNPAKPRHVRDFGLSESRPHGNGSPRGKGVHTAELLNDRLYISYNPYSDGTLQIVDVDKLLRGQAKIKAPFAPTDENLRYPQIARLDLPSYWGVHTAHPLLGLPIPDYQSDQKGRMRDILVVVSEGGAIRCDRPRHAVFLLDITERQYPMPISSFQVPESAGHFCSRDVYFGPHNIQSMSASMYDGKLLFIAYFGAGLRVVDIRNPFSPVEVGYYIPAATANTQYVETKGPWKGRVLEDAPLTNSVEVDSRGNIYIGDRASTGVHVLALTGAAAQIAGMQVRSQLIGRPRSEGSACAGTARSGVSSQPSSSADGRSQRKTSSRLCRNTSTADGR